MLIFVKNQFFILAKLILNILFFKWQIDKPMITNEPHVSLF